MCEVICESLLELKWSDKGVQMEMQQYEYTYYIYWLWIWMSGRVHKLFFFFFFEPALWILLSLSIASFSFFFFFILKILAIKWKMYLFFIYYSFSQLFTHIFWKHASYSQNSTHKSKKTHTMGKTPQFSCKMKLYIQNNFISSQNGILFSNDTHKPSYV